MVNQMTRAEPDAPGGQPVDNGSLAWGEPLARALVEHSADVILVLTVDHRCRFASPAVRPVLGYEPDEVLGGDVIPLHHPEDLPRAAAMLGEAATNPGLPARAEVRLRHKDGTWRWMAVVARDVTEQRRSLKEVEPVRPVGRHAGRQRVANAFGFDAADEEVVQVAGTDVGTDGHRISSGVEPWRVVGPDPDRNRGETLGGEDRGERLAEHLARAVEVGRPRGRVIRQDIVRWVGGDGVDAAREDDPPTPGGERRPEDVERAGHVVGQERCLPIGLGRRIGGEMDDRVDAHAGGPDRLGVHDVDGEDLVPRARRVAESVRLSVGKAEPVPLARLPAERRADPPGGAGEQDDPSSVSHDVHSMASGNPGWVSRWIGSTTTDRRSRLGRHGGHRGERALSTNVIAVTSDH